MWTATHSTSDVVDTSGFYKALQVWLEKPQVANRRLCGSITVCKFTLKGGLKQSTENISKLQHALATCGNWTEQATEELCDMARGHEVEVIVRDLIPKQTDRYQTVREFILIDLEIQEALFLPLWYIQNGEATGSLEIWYMITYRKNDGVHLSLYEDPGRDPESRLHSCSKEWLIGQLVPKLVKWSREQELNTAPSTLTLIPLERYNQLYHELKEKYGRPLVKIWPDKTDPQKFVFEDIGIATYLLVLWEEERKQRGIKEKQSFVDLGCGNGLLVHLLASEGHPGIGVDIRRRNIWDIFGPEAVLKEQPITPSDSNLFPEYDWLIGNHSDELTPWIPVIAARSSYHCNFFVLPCCAHDFDSKYHHQVSGKSQYQAYIDYVQEIGEMCGFHTEKDTLRIPSTKKVCLIGRSRNYAHTEEDQLDQNRTEFIEKRCALNKHSSKVETPRVNSVVIVDRADGTVTDEDIVPSDDDKINQTQKVKTEPRNSSSSTDGSQTNWAPNFTARKEGSETVKNCVSLDPEFRINILRTAFRAVMDADSEKPKCLSDGRTWHRGGEVPLGELVALFDQLVLQQLKSECGGLQTVLRNCSQAFLVKGGKVQLRDPTDEEQMRVRTELLRRKKRGKPTDTTDRRKLRLCFFHEQHPDGCPLVAEDCHYAHGPGELRILRDHKDTASKFPKMEPKF